MIIFITKKNKKNIFFLAGQKSSIFGEGRHAMLGGRNFTKFLGQTATRGARSVKDDSFILLKFFALLVADSIHAARDTINSKKCK